MIPLKWTFIRSRRFLACPSSCLSPVMDGVYFTHGSPDVLAVWTSDGTAKGTRSLGLIGDLNLAAKTAAIGVETRCISVRAVRGLISLPHASAEDQDNETATICRSLHEGISCRATSSED